MRGTLTDEEQSRLDEVFEEAEDLADDKKADAGLRNEAIAVLALDPSDKYSDVLIDLATNEPDQSVRIEAIAALARNPDERVADVSARRLQGTHAGGAGGDSQYAAGAGRPYSSAAR